MATLLNREQVNELLRYEPETGLFFWKVDRRGGANAGDHAGSFGGLGYLQITIGGRAYQAHRLAWLVVHGSMPGEQIDHKNGNRLDNRIENLRLATSAQNGQNQKTRSDSTTRLKGAFPNKGRYLAQIQHRGKKIHLGMFSTAEAAHAAYCKAASEIFGEFARTA